MPDRDHVSSEPSGTQSQRRSSFRWIILGGAAVELIFIAQLWIYFVPSYYAGVDEATYFLTAKSLATHHTPAVHSPDPLVFMPANLNEVRPGVFYQKYPIGFPLLVAIGYKLGGVTGAFLVNPIIGCLAVLAAMALTAELAGAGWGIFVGVILAIHPLTVFYSTAALSHISNLACVLAALWCLWRWQSRGGIFWTAGAGIFLGYAVSIRYTDALLGLPVTWIVAFRMRQVSRRQLSSELFAMVIGGVIALTPLPLFQWAAYGSPLRTGYGLTRESTAFSWHAFQEHVGPVLKMMIGVGFGIPAMSAVAILGLIVWIVGLSRRSLAAGAQWKPVGFLVLWIVPGLLLYTSYYWSSPYPTLYMRLFLGAYAGILVASAATLAAVSQNHRWLQISFAVLLIAIALASRVASDADDVLGNNWSIEKLTQEGTELARAVVPSDAVLITDDWMAYPAVFATDCQVIDQGYFDAKLVAEQNAIAGSNEPLRLNPLRAQRYLPLVAGKSQAQLDQLLREEIGRKLDEGHSIALLTRFVTHEGEPDRLTFWSKRLEDFKLTEMGRGEAMWIVYRVTR